MFVHGYPDAHTCWDEVIELVSDRFHMVAYDVRGVGRSTGSGARDEYTLAKLALDLGAVLELSAQTGRCISSATIGAHSSAGRRC